MHPGLGPFRHPGQKAPDLLALINVALMERNATAQINAGVSPLRFAPVEMTESYRTESDKTESYMRKTAYL
jgi:hypothetical protein